MSAMTDQMIHTPIHMEDFLDLSVDPDAPMVDPHLTMPFFSNLSGKDHEQLTVDPSVWSNTLNPFAGSPGDFDTSLPSELGHADDDNVYGGSDDATGASSPPNLRTRMSSKPSRTSSKSSVPSLSSGSSSPGVRQTRTGKVTKKKEPKESKDHKSPKPPKATKSSRGKPKAPKEVEVVVDDDDDDNGAGESTKRSKYLERNRIAASKCRQKKKAWVCDLESQKCELEAMHTNLQREYSSLVDQVTQLKTELMGHAGCGDLNIDGWIDSEAKRFVQKTTDQPGDRLRRVSNVSSFGGQSPDDESFIQPSPSMSADTFPLSPMIKHEEINYDHMPDDMFE